MYQLMRTTQLLKIISSIGVLFLSCCTNAKINEADLSGIELEKKRLDESNFFISLPKSYSIKEYEGEDFAVYYFAPLDSTIGLGSGGIYFGRHPSRFYEDSSTCKVEKIKGMLLDKNTTWELYNCKKEVKAETIIGDPKIFCVNSY